MNVMYYFFNIMSLSFCNSADDQCTNAFVYRLCDIVFVDVADVGIANVGLADIRIAHDSNVGITRPSMMLMLC